MLCKCRAARYAAAANSHTSARGSSVRERVRAPAPGLATHKGPCQLRGGCLTSLRARSRARTRSHAYSFVRICPAEVPAPARGTPCQIPPEHFERSQRLSSRRGAYFFGAKGRTSTFAPDALASRAAAEVNVCVCVCKAAAQRRRHLARRLQTRRGLGHLRTLCVVVLALPAAALATRHCRGFGRPIEHRAAARKSGAKPRSLPRTRLAPPAHCLATDNGTRTAVYLVDRHASHEAHQAAVPASQSECLCESPVTCILCWELRAAQSPGTTQVPPTRTLQRNSSSCTVQPGTHTNKQRHALPRLHWIWPCAITGRH